MYEHRTIDELLRFGSAIFGRFRGSDRRVEFRSARTGRVHTARQHQPFFSAIISPFVGQNSSSAPLAIKQEHCASYAAALAAEANKVLSATFADAVDLHACVLPASETNEYPVVVFTPTSDVDNRKRKYKRCARRSEAMDVNEAASTEAVGDGDAMQLTGADFAVEAEDTGADFGDAGMDEEDGNAQLQELAWAEQQDADQASTSAPQPAALSEKERRRLIAQIDAASAREDARVDANPYKYTSEFENEDGDAFMRCGTYVQNGASCVVMVDASTGEHTIVELFNWPVHDRAPAENIEAMGKYVYTPSP